TVTINGKNFTGTTQVNFGGTAATSFTTVSDTTIRAVVSTGSNGNIQVITSNGTATSASVFTFLPAPVITSFTPDSAFAGKIVTIKGQNFNSVTSVRFGGINAATFAIISDTVINATVSNGATGNISVTSNNGTGSLMGFVYTGPVLNSFNPTTGGLGTIVTIKGKNLTGTSFVRFGNVLSSNFTVLSDSIITAIVGTGSSGFVVCSSSFGTAFLNGFVHTGPSITSFNPNSGNEGTIVTITGTNFSNITNVSFGGISATSFSVINSTTITAVVARGATGNVAVSNSLGTSSIGTFRMIPVITSLQPNFGVIGSSLVIKGRNFNPTALANTLYFGNVKTAVLTATDTTLSTLV
ncbi:MAG: IPT/TIG domain-containing protein, partial [Dolichospermum sp.]